MSPVVPVPASISNSKSISAGPLTFPVDKLIPGTILTLLTEFSPSANTYAFAPVIAGPVASPNTDEGV